jgi:hypothetical protein
MYDQAVAVVLENKRASISLVQRHLRIGYNRAARLLEQMEKSGLVGALASNGSRELLVPRRSDEGMKVGRRLILALALAALAPMASADALAQLSAFQREVKSGRVGFTQTVTSPSGKKRVSKGRFEFQRPNRFRFDYEPPEAQTLIGDGQKVWLIDPDLNQASSRPAVGGAGQHARGAAGRVHAGGCLQAQQRGR